PLALSGVVVDAERRLRERIVAGAMAAVVVGRWCFDRQIDEAKILVHGDLRPHAGVAVNGPRFLFPAVVAEFARTWNRVELPQLFAGPRIVGAHQPLGVVVGRHRRPFAHRRPDDDDVFGDGGRGVTPDFSGLEIDLFAFAFHHADLEIDDAVLAEARHRRAG